MGRVVLSGFCVPYSSHTLYCIIDLLYF